MNFLKEIREANERAQQRNPRYLTQDGGYGGKGADEVWEQMSPETRQKWEKHKLPRAWLTDPYALTSLAAKRGINIDSV